MAGINWITDLSGTTNQYTDPGMMQDNQWELLVNASQSQIGSIAHRPGTDLYHDLIAGSGQVQGLQMYMKEDGTFYFHAVLNGHLKVGNETTNVWDNQESSVVATTSDVDFTNFIGRHYFIGSADTEYLRYASESGSSTLVTIFSTTVSASSTGSTLVADTEIFNSGMVGLTVSNTTDGTTRVITAYTNATTVTVDSAINDTWDTDTIKMYVEGKYLASNGPYMMIAGNDNRRVYWTNVGSDTINTALDYHETVTPHTGLISFGNGRPFIVFEEDAFTIVDPARNYIDEKQGIGASSHKAIKVVRGNAIWPSRIGKGFYMLSPDASSPEIISLPITNDTTNDAIINQILGDSWSTMAAGVSGDRYLCSVGNLVGTVKGETLNDCVLELNVTQQNWKVHTYTTGGIGSIFAEFIDEDGNSNLYAGSRDNFAVYKLDVAGIYTDDDSTGATNPVTMTAKTKHHENRSGMRGTVDFMNILKVHMKYKSATDITVQTALDGSTTYAAHGLPVFPAANTNRWYWDYQNYGDECKSIGFSFSTTGECIIFDYGYEVESLDNEGIKGR